MLQNLLLVIITAHSIGMPIPLEPPKQKQEEVVKNDFFELDFLIKSGYLAYIQGPGIEIKPVSCGLIRKLRKRIIILTLLIGGLVYAVVKAIM